jgi:hypothetical protein
VGAQGQQQQQGKQMMTWMVSKQLRHCSRLCRFGQVLVGGLPPELADVCEALNEHKQLEDGRLVLQPAAQRGQLWQLHMYIKFPHFAAAAGHLLSAYVTSCATECNWPLFGKIFSKMKNMLALEHAEMLAYIRSNSSERTVGVDEELQLSVIDMLDNLLSIC